MSEQMKNTPEKWQSPEPWKAKCNNEQCSTKEYTLDETNAAMVDYSDKRECNFIFSKCPDCEYALRVYVDGLDPEEANIRGIGILEDEKIPDDRIFQEWLGVKGHEIPTVYELTPRHEKIIAHFGEVLRNCPDDLIYDGISTPTKDMPYPHRWV